MGRDRVEVAVLPLDEVSAPVEVWRLEAARLRSALEDAWLLSELVDRHGLNQTELAHRLRRSKSWVSQRLGLLSSLPEVAQETVRCGRVAAQAAMKPLVPLARASVEHCSRLVVNLGDEAVANEEQGDEGLRHARDLEGLAGACARVRRRVREGAFARANTASQETARRSWREARLAFAGLAEPMDQEEGRAGPGDPNRDLSAAP